jgi:uncharacterized protein (TIGR02453 family)
MSSMATETTSFQGFADDSGRFFHTLAKHQDRVWFGKHKEEYEQGWAQPMAALLAAIADKLDAAYPDVDLAEPKVFRLHRDVRFSKDKAPYKTHVSGLLAAKRVGAVTELPAALYVQFGTETFCAAGQYGMRGDALARYRAAVVDDAKGKELAKLVAKLEKAGFSLGAMEVMKKVPRGLDAAHPRERLLRHKGLVMSFTLDGAPKLSDPKLAGWLLAQAKKAAPLVRWLTFATA